MSQEPDLPDWSKWTQRENEGYSLGIEEELMLLNGDDFSLANRIDAVMPRLPESMVAQATQETHSSVLELCTGVHTSVSDAVRQIEDLRTEVADTLAALDLRIAGSGTHPFATWEETTLSGGDRQQFVHGSMRELAKREPTFALHVHVGLPDPDLAIQACNRMRVHLPLLLALSANSPFWQGRDTGLASSRTPLFQAFPRVGIPRPFFDYAHYVETVDLLITTAAIPDRSHLWWDIRPHPGIGTIEIRVMDVQTKSADTTALVALTRSLIKLEADEGFVSDKSIEAQEALTENRFIAARDGIHGELIDIDGECRRPVREILETCLSRARPHADELGCREELEASLELIDDPPADRQRQVAGEVPSLAQMVRHLADEFV